MPYRLPLLGCLSLLLAAMPLRAAAQTAPVWEIGAADNSGAEFALAPGDYAGFKEDAFFLVGCSDPARDWPYVHPGIAEVWAGSRAHPFSVLFDLANAPGEGEARLVLDLVDTHPSRAPYLKIFINGTLFEGGTPTGSGNEEALKGAPGAGKEYRHELTFPANLLKTGENLIEIRNHAGSWMLYDSVAFFAPGATLSPILQPRSYVGELQMPPVLLERDGVQKQMLRVRVHHSGNPATAALRAGADEAVSFPLQAGENLLDLPVTPVTSATPVQCTLEIDGQPVTTREALLQPVRPWILYLLHHTHLDIGYTHVQTEVEQMQWQHLENALDLAEKTKDYPEGAQFKWLPEGLWAIDSYLAQATPEQRARFAGAVKTGQVGLDALYGNELTALCRPEELLELLGRARRLEGEIGVDIDSAMITDVPGYTWGTVTALAQSGVKFFSIGPNATHRIGFTLEDWGDKAFYWLSPSGKEKVLCWVAGKAYSWFHRGPLTEEDRIFEYLVSLEQAEYPYNEVQVRYNIGGDNGPPDPNICDYVRAWNARYAFPKLRLVTTSEMFREFEAVNAARIPEVRGDFTPYWEDGAASTAAETALNRDAAERLVQAQTLFALLQPKAFPRDRFEAAWRNVLLYDEHTWGAHNSISEPEVEFVKQQWGIKRAFAVDADQQSRALLQDALARVRKEQDAVRSVLVFNTQSWERTDVVTLPAEWTLAGETVTTAEGRPALSQRLSNGQLVFLAEDVPPLSSVRFSLGEGSPAGSPLGAGAHTLANEHLSLALDPATGNITSLRRLPDGPELVDASAGLALNQYLYTQGRDAKDTTSSGAATVRVKEQGPLVVSLLAESPAPGCNVLSREVRLYAGLDRIDIIDLLDRQNVYEPEGVHIAFPFNVPGGTVRMETPFAVVRPEVDQLKGACKNYFTVQRWVDVSNDTLGVTMAVLDAPMLEVGAIVNDARHLGFLRETPPGSTIYSYVMNNYWETNYKASQPGPTTFRYALRAHAHYDQGAAQRFGVEQSQPLIAVPGETAYERPPLWDNPNIHLLNIEPLADGAFLLRCFNAGAHPARLAVLPVPGYQFFQSTLDGEKLAPLTGPISMTPQELVSIRVEE